MYKVRGRVDQPANRSGALPCTAAAVLRSTSQPPGIGRPMVERRAVDFRRDRLTWIAYGMLAWFAYLQAAPGLVIAHLRDELDLSYSAGGLHVAAFAAGSIVAGVGAARLERVIGRR